MNDRRILVVEDDAIISSLLQDALLAWGYLPLAVSSGEEAVKLTAGTAFDLILMDITLSGEMDGIEAASEIQIGSDVPIIYLTAHSDPSILERVKASSPYGYLVKPIKDMELRANIEMAIHKHKLDTRLKEAEEELQKANQELENRVRERTVELAAANEELKREIEERKLAEEALRESEAVLRFLSSRLLAAQEEERKRIVGEIHDTLGSSLSAVKISLENARRQMDTEGLKPGALDVPISWIQHAIDEARRLIMDLRPSVLDDLGLLAAVGAFLRQYRSLHPDIHIEERLEIEESDLPEPLKIVFFRIMQEAFHNISKYSRTKAVVFSIAKKAGAIELRIEDRGVGFDVDAALRSRDGRRGLGLTSMKERCELSGGMFRIESVRGQGTVIQASWPVKS